jgi:hypothetical protein
VRFHGQLAPHAKGRDEVVPHPQPASPSPDELSAPAPHPSPGGPSAYRLPWAVLLARTFAVDVLTCPRCGAPRRLIAVITEPRVIRSILERLGLPPEPPPRSAARPPPQSSLDFPETA